MVEAVPEKGVIGKQFRKDAKVLMEWLGQLERSEVESLESRLEQDG